jgi:hypothetical protein
MPALANSQKQANYRRRKAASDFASEYNLGSVPTVEEFLQAKAEQETPGYICVSLDAGFANRVYDELHNYDHDMASEYLDFEEMDGKDDWPAYSVADMIEAWDTVSREFA